MRAACTNLREAKRHQTAVRLQECAVSLTLDRGFDGWTMDDLAAAADVSRRTVFNYFDGKAEVVLGPEPAVEQALIDAFVAGGPTGNLFDDLVALAREATREKTGPEQHIAALREAVMNNPHLLRLVHLRFEDACTMLGETVRAREGEHFPDDKVRILLRLVVGCFDTALERTAADDAGGTFAAHFDAVVTDVRALLA